jgi:predicted AAA+ superfamily ATPase
MQNTPCTLSEMGFMRNIDTYNEMSGFQALPYIVLLIDELAYTDTLLRQDVLEFEEIEKVNAIRQVYTLLASKVGSPISYKSISEDVGIAPATAKRYIEILEALYIIFIIRPYTHKIARAILKEPKVYFFDYGLIGDQGARFENLVALALYKHVTLKTDEIGREHKLGFLKTKENKEVDFALSDDQNNLIEIVEAKLSDKSPGGALEYFSQKYKIKSIQVVKNLDLNMERSIKGVEIRSAEKYLKTLEK